MVTACERGRGNVTPLWIFNLCRKGEALLFVFFDEKIKAAWVCQVQESPKGETLHFLVACGEDMDDWIGQFRPFCKMFNVKRVEFGGRNWAAKIPGARPLFRVFEVMIEDGSE